MCSECTDEYFMDEWSLDYYGVCTPLPLVDCDEYWSYKCDRCVAWDMDLYLWLGEMQCDGCLDSPDVIEIGGECIHYWMDTWACDYLTEGCTDCYL